MTHPLEMTSPNVAAAVVGVPKERTATAVAALGREGVRGITVYTEGPVWGLLYGALANSAVDGGADELGAAKEAARAELRSHEIDGMEMLARMEGRVAAKAGESLPNRSQYEGHREHSWRLRAMLLACDPPYPSQLMDIAHCLRNGGMSESDILSKL